MKNNSINNKKEVLYIHPGCSMAETGFDEYDDFDNPLKLFDFVPEGKEVPFERHVENYKADGEEYEDVYLNLPPEIKNPSQVRDEPNVTVNVPVGVHPVTFLKDIGVDFTKAWVFIRKEVVETMRKLPLKYHQNTIAYGEFFRFEDFEEVSLQGVMYLPEWRIILEGKIGGEDFKRIENPECIIEVVM